MKVFTSLMVLRKVTLSYIIIYKQIFYKRQIRISKNHNSNVALLKANHNPCTHSFDKGNVINLQISITQTKQK